MPIPLTDTLTLPGLLSARIQQTPNTPAYRQYTERGWVSLTWREVGHQIQRWRAALRMQNLNPGDRVAIAARNRVEWVVFDQAALSLGLVMVPLYFNDRPDNMAWCLNNAGVRLLVLENAGLWSLLKPQVSTIEKVVLLQSGARDDKTSFLEDWLPASPEIPEIISPRIPLTPDTLATIVYTSGTTGRPKGVMLSHRNIVSDLSALLDAAPEMIDSSHRFLSFLPLSHMLERTVGYYIPLCMGAEVIFARGIPELAEDLVQQRPSLIVCVPRIFERIYTKLENSLPPNSLKFRLLHKTAAVGWRRFQKQASWWEHAAWPLLDFLAGRPFRRRLGGRLRFVFIGGASMAPHLFRFFTGLGLTFIHGYGLTESSPGLTCNRIAGNDPLSVGPPLRGVDIRLGDNGEVLARGPMIMLGYWNNPAATAAAIDADGWLHTGDLAEIRNGRVYLTGRLKDIIVLSNGEKVPPEDAERAILLDPAFEQVMLVGEGRPALGLLVVSKVEDEKELCARANQQLYTFPGYAKIRHVVRVSEPWTMENGLLTPTLKLKRHKIEERYAKEIEAMYLGPTREPTL